jgi:hypothetical protein
VREDETGGFLWVIVGAFLWRRRFCFLDVFVSESRVHEGILKLFKCVDCVEQCLDSRH